ncbi:transposase [Micromonospora sp. 4G55]|uniref:transposase n=1 Tax=Micromonospora sp. 4G55 TaxID=2806102 RepID=UPI0035C6E9B6
MLGVEVLLRGRQVAAVGGLAVRDDHLGVAAGIPDEVEFTAKPQLAKTLLPRALDAGVPVGWVNADEADGQVKRLRVWLEKRDVGYVLATRRNDDMITTIMGAARADELIAALPARAWCRLSAGAGAHGPPSACGPGVPVLICWRPGRGHWLLARRSITTGEIAYYVWYGPRRARGPHRR